jgi:hypothetical protein
MKIIKYNTALLLMFFLISNVYAQEMKKGYKQNIEMTADEKGDVIVASSIKYNAQTWDAVKQMHMTDASVMKNMLKKAFPKYQLSDFDIKNDDMERATNARFKLLGSLKIDDNGKWIAELDSKNPDITKISDNQFLLVDEESAQTLKINLPKSASNAKVEKDNFGKAILTYTAPISGGGAGNIIKYLGFLVAAAGGFLFFKNRKLNTVIVSNQQQQKINYQNTKHIDDTAIGNEPMQQNLSAKKDIYGNRQ